jgi:hypothetical protein
MRVERSTPHGTSHDARSWPLSDVRAQRCARCGQRLAINVDSHRASWTGDTRAARIVATSVPHPFG